MKQLGLYTLIVRYYVLASSTSWFACVFTLWLYIVTNWCWDNCPARRCLRGYLVVKCGPHSSSALGALIRSVRTSLWLQISIILEYLHHSGQLLPAIIRFSLAVACISCLIVYFMTLRSFLCFAMIYHHFHCTCSRLL